MPKLKAESKLLNVEKQKRKEKFKKLVLMNKLDYTQRKIKTMLDERNSLLEKRREAALRAKKRREELNKAMDNIRRTKKWHQAEALLDNALEEGKSGKQQQKTGGLNSMSSKQKQKESRLGFDTTGLLRSENKQKEALLAVKERVDNNLCPPIGVAGMVASSTQEFEVRKTGAGDHSKKERKTPHISPYKKSTSGTRQTRQQLKGKGS